MSRNSLHSYLDDLEIADFFESDFDITYGVYDNGQKFGKIIHKQNQLNYIQFSIYPNHWHIDTLRGPGIGSQLLLTCFREAINEGISFIELNAFTTDENIRNQESLEDWYRKFGFETIHRGVDGTKMRAITQNRPLEFRYKELVGRILAHEHA